MTYQQFYFFVGAVFTMTIWDNYSAAVKKGRQLEDIIIRNLTFIQKQPLKGVLEKRCSQNMQQI